ncbi:uncharacterized protein [Periplaneta americana]|uniref:uncharacterized protein isoform X3 n=1 Tax=Periplaneta americana TaxID=6978 RepID=UPI0037E925D8
MYVYGFHSAAYPMASVHHQERQHILKVKGVDSEDYSGRKEVGVVREGILRTGREKEISKISTIPKIFTSIPDEAREFQCCGSEPKSARSSFLDSLS